MKYFAVFWQHDFKEEPAWMAYEVDRKENVVRMIEFFSSGLHVFKDLRGEVRDSVIDVSFNEKEIINSELNLYLFETTREAFDMNWEKLTRQR